MSVATFLAADPACFGSADVALTGWEDRPNGIDGASTYVEPNWLGEQSPAVLVDRLPPACGSENTCEPFLFVHADPASALRFERDGHYVVITGHRQDPTADTCLFHGPSGDDGVPVPSPNAVLEACRDAFVLTSVRDVDPPAGSLDFCPSDPVLTVDRYSATDPACFHGRTLALVGWAGSLPGIDFDGPTIDPAWLAFPQLPFPALWSVKPSTHDGLPYCPDASSDGSGSCAWIFVMSKPGTGVSLAGGHGWVLLTGHIDDPASETCHFTDGGPFGGPIPPALYARQSCRESFVVTTVAITTAPTPP